MVTLVKKKKILLSPNQLSDLIEKFPVSKTTIYKALSYETNSQLSSGIRGYAKKIGGILTEETRLLDKEEEKSGNASSTPKERLVSTRQAANILGVSLSTIYHAMAYLPHIKGAGKKGHVWFYESSLIDSFTKYKTSL